MKFMKKVMKAVKKVAKKVAAKPKAKLGSGERFKTLKGKLAKKGVKKPAALAAVIGRKKLGTKKMTKLAVAGKKKK